MKIISISVLLVFLIFHGFDINAEELSTENVCNKSKITFDTSSLKYIFLHSEEILLDPEEFWESDPAYKIIKKILTYLKRPIPYEKWKKNIGAIAELSQEERKKNQYYLIAGEIEEKVDYVNSTAVSYVCSYFPKASKLDISFTVHLTAYTGAYRTMYQNTLVIDAAHSRWGGSSEKILNNLVRVLFDIGYSKIRAFRTEEPLHKKVYRLLELLHIRGMCTYVAYKALHLLPAVDIPEFTMLENHSEVARLRNNLNNVFSNAKKMSEEDLWKSANKIGIRDKAYYVVGAYMAKTIEEKLGRKGLMDTLTKGPRGFVQTYNSLVGSGEKIYEFESDN
ncbi:MAG: hypothetical protein JSV96_17305 [Candidatus Aminicenantes bacterium]|nr:MAG: hypothetical protein JSV96_17305 [Candidatus Aminicenantes bacterium]